ncbi:recombinase family protein [Shewanella sp. SR44-4]|uniref:recombinase family protein n=1 Tax=Shewanella sp. SR44-4 TaxID=2760935 RepID=UPI0016046214|nr:recombinase family protein [Shewanella sp. SR44-4]MBB1363024.1 recombinase family protein [Shewanella sp. SR44-4]
MKKAYSYIRYSSPQQASGDSFRRQLAATQAYCDKNGYELDTELSLYKELGISGFTGDQEHLKRFIDDCETNKIKKGSLLIVENLDRLSRQAINIAMRQLLHLLDFVDIYTTQDNKLYSHHNDKNSENQLLDIMTSLIIMSRAYEESATKQKRLKAAWHNKRENIQSKKLTTLIPHWLELNEDWTDFHIKHDKVEIIKYIYQKCIDGMGVTQLLRHLNENIDQFPTPTSKSSIWARTSISRILTDRSILGEYQPHQGKHSGIGENKRKPIGDVITDYYPQIIDEETFLKAQIARKSRVVGRGKSGRETFSNLFRNILHCAVCAGKMEYVDKGDGSKGGKYLTCSNAKRGGECTQNKHFKYLPTELMLLHLVTENGFMPKPEAPSELNIRLSKLQELHNKSNEKLDILLESDFTIPAVKRKVNELSKSIESYCVEIEDLESKILIFKPDYKYSDLYNDVILENDKLKLYSNRITFSTYLKSKIEAAYYLNSYCPFILFKMNDGKVHTVILDSKYNFGGCTLPDGRVSFKRVSGDSSPVDELIWTIQESFISLVVNSKDFEDERYKSILNKINLLISKFVLSQDECLLDELRVNIKNASAILQEKVI